MKKEIIATVLFIIAMIAIMVVGVQRIDKINNGEMELVSQSEMDR